VKLSCQRRLASRSKKIALKTKALDTSLRWYDKSFALLETTHYRNTMSDFLSIVRERGFIHQLTDEAGLQAALKSGPQTAYIGFDCTAKSLHVGSLLQIMLLRWWQKTGNKPIVLLGGGTTKIGDPSGKDASRPALTDADIASNMISLREVFAEFLKFGDGATDAIMVNNDDWLKDINYIDFLRDYGRHFSINRMLGMDSVKLRLEREQNLSFLEFNYMILQAYDFVKLNEDKGCRVQMGGSDQWGNIINGIELNRKLAQTDIFGITSPLMTTASGTKMGKTADGAVWLNADMLTPYDYWQFWRNTEDADVERFLKLFTDLSLNEIAKLAALQGAEINEAKKVLATEATTLLHGRAAAETSAATAAATFAGGTGDNLPEVSVSADALHATSIIALLVQLNFAASNGEARRLIKGGGIRVNDAVVSDENAKLTQADMASGQAKISAGKKRHGVVKLG
jgi:tyrosyl-tRNA synthetase